MRVETFPLINFQPVIYDIGQASNDCLIRLAASSQNIKFCIEFREPCSSTRFTAVCTGVPITLSMLRTSESKDGHVEASEMSFT